MPDYLITQKPTFLTELLALPPKEAHQVHEKLITLTKDPRPDGKVRKQLKGWSPPVYRLRSGDYRIFYSFDDRYVSLLALRRRAEDTYDAAIEAEDLGGLDAQPARIQSKWNNVATPATTPSTPLPQPLSVDFLNQMRIPANFHRKLLAVRTRDELLEQSEVADEFLLRLDEALFERPLAEVFAQPDLVSSSVDDLFRYKEGDLAGFLLKLSPEQQSIVDKPINNGAEVLVRGGPGSGKSTIALYRAAKLASSPEHLPGTPQRILFTTYTNALAMVSRDLLAALLGDRTSRVEIMTADAIMHRILTKAGVTFRTATQEQILASLKVARRAGAVGNDPFERGQASERLAALTDDFLYEELSTIIDGWQIDSLSQYLALQTPGREPLGRLERTAIWAMKAIFDQQMALKGVQTWSQARRQAARLARSGRLKPVFDAVVIDEAQDLEPTVIAVLRCLLKPQGELFITADANQSIYGSSFRWSTAHQEITERAAVSTLHANYRSTREIATAAHAYLQGANLDEMSLEQAFVHDGPLPVLRRVHSQKEEGLLLATFIEAATRQLHLTKSSAVILCPSATEGERLALALRSQGHACTFMLSKDLDIKAPGIKILPLRAAKGLEFPIVALAGFWPPYPHFASGAGREERELKLRLEKRAVFVGMTRAMRALLIVTPDKSSPPFENFDRGLWNTDESSAC